MPAAISAIDSLVSAAPASRSAASRSDSARGASETASQTRDTRSEPDSFDALVGAASALPASQTQPSTPRTRAGQPTAAPAATGEQPASPQPTPPAGTAPAGQGVPESAPAAGESNAAGKGDQAKSAATGKAMPASTQGVADPAPSASAQASSAQGGAASSAAPTTSQAPNAATQPGAAAAPVTAEPAPGAVTTASAETIPAATSAGTAGTATTPAQASGAPETPAQNTSAQGASVQATPAQNTSAQAMPAETKSAQPPVMAVITPGAGEQTQVENGAAVPANAQQSAATAGAAVAATATAARTATAELAPSGRFGQARKALDEREGPAAAGSKAGTAKASTGQGAANPGNSTTAAQPSTATASPQKPDLLAVHRDGQAAPPPAPAPLPAAPPTGGELFRMPAGTGDTATIATTDTQAGALRGEHRNVSDAGAGQPPRFSQQTAAQLAGQITQRFNNGSRVFGIRLDPAELGRVDVRLEITRGNKVHATLTAERGDTLAEMQRSSRDLERALSDAGLELGEDGIDFQLSDGNPEQDPTGDSGPGTSFNVYGQDAPDSHNLTGEIDQGPSDAYGFLLSRRDGVDLRV